MNAFIRNTLPSVLMAEDKLSNYLLQPMTLLVFRLYVSWVFFASGLTKIQSWSSTLYLFEDEYKVPVLPPELAAYLGTAAELMLPILLVLGLLARPAAVALFVFNIIAVVSYPYLWTIEGAGGYWQHVYWGALLLTIIMFGPGQFALDRFIQFKRPSRLITQHSL